MATQHERIRRVNEEQLSGSVRGRVDTKHRKTAVFGMTILKQAHENDTRASIGAEARSVSMTNPNLPCLIVHENAFSRCAGLFRSLCKAQQHKFDRASTTTAGASHHRNRHRYTQDDREMVSSHCRGCRCKIGPNRPWAIELLMRGAAGL